MQESKSGSVMVVGGGIAGIQASLDLAGLGYQVYLIEKAGSIGGVRRRDGQAGQDVSHQ
jgi:heterodisulfide reductase subunit A